MERFGMVHGLLASNNGWRVLDDDDSVIDGIGKYVHLWLLSVLLDRLKCLKTRTKIVFLNFSQFAFMCVFEEERKSALTQQLCFLF